MKSKAKWQSALGSLAFASFALLTLFTLAPQASAASVYNVDRTTATVGTAQTYELEYTVDHGLGGGQQTWADGDTLSITLPSNLPKWANLTFTVEYDADVTNDGVGETAILEVPGNGTYSVDIVNDRQIDIIWDVTTWGAVNDDASTIRVLITASAAPTFADSTTEFTWEGATVAMDSQPSGTDTVDVSASDAAASVSLSDPRRLERGNVTTLTFTLGYAMAANDTVVFTMPSNLDVSGVAYSSDTFDGAGVFSCAASGQVVTCTADDAITAGTGNILMTGIYATVATSSQTVTSLAVNDNSAGDADISSDASGTVTDTKSASGGSNRRTTSSAAETQSSPTTVTTTESTPATTTETPATTSETTTGATDEATTTEATVEEATTTSEETEKATELKDVATHWAKDVIEKAQAMEIVKGDPDGNFRPDAGLNRAEAAAIMGRVLGLDGAVVDAAPFTDVEKGIWFGGYVAKLKELGVVKGNPDGTFEGVEAINRAEFLKLAMEAYFYGNAEKKAEFDAMDMTKMENPFADLDSKAWYAKYVLAGANWGFVAGSDCDGKKCFNAERGITRAEAVKIVINIFGTETKVEEAMPEDAKTEEVAS